MAHRFSTKISENAFPLPLLLLLFVMPFLSYAADIDISKLPPPSSAKTDFNQQIKPIFEASCFRCHGPEKPKSGFRLDQRETALKGGENGVDIIPGDSAKSPLIHYVTRVVEDMEMPPTGKGDPLTPEQIGLLRAWIDQGANWGTVEKPPKFEFSMTPMLRFIEVTGDENKFREHWGRNEGWGWGLENFSIQERIDDKTRLTLEGHAIPIDEDYHLKLNLERQDLGFWRAGFSHYRRYSDDTGGYHPAVTPSVVSLNRDLGLEIGRVWTEVGLTLPRWPQAVLGYEYQFRDGEKATTHWGDVGGKKIFPTAKSIDEEVHLIRLDVTYERNGWWFEDNARLEFYELKTNRREVNRYTLGPLIDSSTHTREETTHVQGANTLRMEKQLRDWWFISAGHLYSRTDADAALEQGTFNAFGVPTAGQFWFSDRIVLDQQAQVFSFSTQFGPWEGWTLSAAIQNEWMRQEGLGNVHLDEGDPNLPFLFNVLPATLKSDLDKHALVENLGVRFSRIPFTTFYADSRFQQEHIGHFERQQGSDPFLRDTDATSDWFEHRVGFHSSPWPKINFSGHYKRKDRFSDYDHDRDINLLGSGYSAFILERQIQGDEIKAKVSWRPLNWLRAAASYQWIDTDYRTTTAPVSDAFGVYARGGEVFAGNHNAHNYSLELGIIPFQRFYLSAIFSYSQSRTKTEDNDRPEVSTYRGDVFSLLGTASYAFNQRTDLNGSYLFSRSDYAQKNLAGLPLGLEYGRHALQAGVRHRFNKNYIAQWQYAYYRYDESNLRGVNDYEAHGLFATLSIRWP